MAHTERTTAFGSIAGTGDVVLEDTGGTVVGETFAKLDNGDKESTLGKRLSNLAKRLQFLGGRPDTTETVVLVVDGGIRADIHRMRLLNGGVGTGDVGVVECGTVEVRLLVSDLLTVLECLSAGDGVSISSEYESRVTHAVVS